MNTKNFLIAFLVLVNPISLAQHNEVHNHNPIENTSLGNIFEEIKIDFELSDHNGNKISVRDFFGQFIFIGFGFTNCPNVCPMMAFNIGNTINSLEIDATGIFISVDSERDTPQITHKYASNFGENMIGLSGSFEEINKVANNFNISYAITKTQNNYTVQHTSNIYIITPSGELLDIVPFNTSSSELIDRINKL
ncbi:MAG: hypothetical protein CBC38_04220 [Gammaproteobacteria bacterium TMED78]|nr:MAG: hypothetical protein CBC38_04220 [Gammaproteobacteria bacterium TMED78]|tara:strand:- start:41 stop:622 length:582 start_codon:yes stop_codon:yes gene_type:complete